MLSVWLKENQVTGVILSRLKNTNMQNDTEIKGFHNLVMLVDDSSIDNFVNTKVIRRNNFADDVVEFTKSEHALKYLIRLNNEENAIVPGILFLDLDMPEIDGFEFLNAFELLPEKIRSSMHIFILSSSINPEDIETCSKHKSVLSFMHKPLMKNNLDAINTLLLQKTLT
jgi:CheY-like chemotaxis protein